jgi:hypothetical protein
MIDWVASSAALDLRNSPWSPDELFTIERPATAKSKRKYDKWIKYREHQYTLNLCARSRAALFEGNWGQAIHDALFAGRHINGALAYSAARSSKGRNRGGGAKRTVHTRANKNREIVIREARKIRTKHKKYSPHKIARDIDEKFEGKDHFPRCDRIRQILREDKSWKIPAGHFQE